MYGTAKIVTSEPTKLLSVPASALLAQVPNGMCWWKLLLQPRIRVSTTECRGDRTKRRLGTTTSGFALPWRSSGQNRRADTFLILYSRSLRLSDEGLRNVDLQTQPVAQQVVEDVLTIDGIIDLPPGRVAAVSSQLAGTLSQVHVDRDSKSKRARSSLISLAYRSKILSSRC